jgi:hypothetical protein
MIEFLKESYRVFAVSILLILFIGGALITRGKLDHWGTRLFKEKRHRMIAILLKKRAELTALANRRLSRNRLPVTPTKEI